MDWLTKCISHLLTVHSLLGAKQSVGLRPFPRQFEISMKGVFPKSGKSLLGFTCFIYVYGMAHAIPRVQSYRTFMYPNHNKPLMLADQFLFGVMIIASTPFTWPWMFQEDLVRLDCFVRGEPLATKVGSDDYKP